MLARDGAHALRQMLLAVLVVAAIAGVAFAVWSLRPTPSYSSEDLAAGSPFDGTFRVENDSPWFAMSNLRFTCVVAHVRGSGMPPASVEATDLRFPAGPAAALEPGEAATFTCPFRALIGHPINDDPGIVQRAEIYFRAEYELPLLGTIRLTDNSAHFFFNTRLLPPRWTRVPPE
jgi:hypothetical protein